MDKNLSNLKQNLSLALRSVPNDKNFDEVYQDIVKLTNKINLIESKSQKRKERKADHLFQNWSMQNGSMINPNMKQNVGFDALQAIDDLIQKEQENLNTIKNKINFSNNDSDSDDMGTLLG